MMQCRLPQSIGSQRSRQIIATRQHDALVSRRGTHTIVRAGPPTQEKPKEKTKQDSKTDKILEELKKTGMTAQKARQVLKAWSDVGVKDDPEALKKLLVKKSLAPLPGLALQTLLDGIASFGGFYIGNMASQAQDFPFRIVFEIIGYFLAFYYSIQFLLEVTVIGGLLYSTYKYGTNSSALLSAVTTMAGQPTGVSIVDRVQSAANVFKVVAALDAVAEMLRKEYGDDSPKTDSLKNLSAYLTLAQAKEALGFSPEKYGLNEKEAGNIAYAFATYDTNQNFKLEPSELRNLCSSLGKDLDEAEVKEAVKILDRNNNGNIEFPEFVEWWVKQPGSRGSTPPRT